MKIIDLFKNERGFNYPYIIAEAGVNHEGDINTAKRLIDQAKEGGADAIKFQTYKAETLATKNSPAYWDRSMETTGNQFELFKKHDSFWKNEFKLLKDYSDKVGIEFLSTPFDKDSALFLNELVDVFKISSSDITNRPFIDLICKFGKPIILSTGASSYDEIEEAVGWILPNGNKLSLMHCVLNYPTSYEKSNLGVISNLRQKYPDLVIGYSDHTLPDIKILEIAYLLGAQIIEKHFTFDKSLKGNDHYHAMDKEDLKLLRKGLDRILQIIGSGTKEDLAYEQSARTNARRSLVASRTMEKDHIILENDLTWKRPAFGISPKHFKDVIGKKTTRRINEDEIFYWDMIN